jgi:hypothetical protein
MRELLIRYLLGELDAQEQRQLEERLRTSPELRRELTHLRTCFAAACDTDHAEEELPRGLAERTTQRVAGADCPSPDHGASRFAACSTAAANADPPAGALGWSLADLAVAGGVFLAVSMLLFPALRDSRDATRATLCQSRQWELGKALFQFAQDHEGFFPKIGPEDNAGMFAVQLVEKGYVHTDDINEWLVCPAAPLADQIRNRKFKVRIPTTAELEALSPDERAEARKCMSPFFAYQFPYRKGNQYYYRQDDRRPHALILSDTSDIEPSELMSPNHHGIVQVLCGDGHVRLFRSYRVPGFNDDMYRNSKGVVAAGCSPRDAVLGRSEATPAGIKFVSRRN